MGSAVRCLFLEPGGWLLQAWWFCNGLLIQPVDSADSVSEILVIFL